MLKISTDIDGPHSYFISFSNKHVKGGRNMFKNSILYKLFDKIRISTVPDMAINKSQIFPRVLHDPRPAPQPQTFSRPTSDPPRTHKHI